jgi:hypothetical protein
MAEIGYYCNSAIATGRDDSRLGLCWRFLRVLLHALLHLLLVPCHDLSQLGFLVGRQDLVSLRGQLGVLQSHLLMNLGFLIEDFLRSRFTEAAAGDELHQGLMALAFLFHQRLYGGLGILVNLLNLRLLRIRQIKNIGQIAEHWSKEVLTVTARSLGNGCAGQQQGRHYRTHKIQTTNFHNLLLLRLSNF